MIGPFEGLVLVSVVGMQKAIFVHDGHFFDFFVLEEYAGNFLSPWIRVVLKAATSLFYELSSSNKKARDSLATVVPNGVADVVRSGRHHSSRSSGSCMWMRGQSQAYQSPRHRVQIYDPSSLWVASRTFGGFM